MCGLTIVSLVEFIWSDMLLAIVSDFGWGVSGGPGGFAVEREASDHSVIARRCMERTCG